MRLPEKTTICDREFRVILKRSRKLAGGGCASWGKQEILIYCWDDTSAAEIVNTYYHEIIEIDAIGRGERFVNEDGKIVFVSGHESLNAKGDLFVRILSELAAVNGWAFDPSEVFKIEGITNGV